MKDINKRDHEKPNDVKAILKVLKVYKKRNKQNELVSGDYNETKYLFQVIKLILFIVTKSIKNLKLKCGEPYLKIAAYNENDGLYDDEHRVKGPRLM